MKKLNQSDQEHVDRSMLWYQGAGPIERARYLGIWEEAAQREGKCWESFRVLVAQAKQFEAECTSKR